MEEFLRLVIGRLVEFPEEAILTKTETPEKITFHLTLRKSDIPKVIGKGGHTIQAIRTLLEASAGRRDQRATLEIVE